MEEWTSYFSYEIPVSSEKKGWNHLESRVCIPSPLYSYVVDPSASCQDVQKETLENVERGSDSRWKEGLNSHGGIWWKERGKEAVLPLMDPPLVSTLHGNVTRVHGNERRRHDAARNENGRDVFFAVFRQIFAHFFLRIIPVKLVWSLKEETLAGSVVDNSYTKCRIRNVETTHVHWSLMQKEYVNHDA